MPIHADPRNVRAQELQAFLASRLDVSELDETLHVVVGGDGFMLDCVRRYYTPDHTFLGLNCGRLGFLLNDLPADREELPELLRSRHRVSTFARIGMQAIDEEGRLHQARALNDIYLERMTGQTCHLEIVINGLPVVKEMVCDGLILSTALGSTAYNYSAGGVPCHPTLEIIQVTPICPHVPRMTPVVLPLRAVIEARVLDQHRRRVRAVADGVETNGISRLTVSDAREPVRLAFFDGHNFTGTLAGKLLHV